MTSNNIRLFNTTKLILFWLFKFFFLCIHLPMWLFKWVVNPPLEYVEYLLQCLQWTPWGKSLIILIVMSAQTIYVLFLFFTWKLFGSWFCPCSSTGLSKRCTLSSRFCSSFSIFYDIMLLSFEVDKSLWCHNIFALLPRKYICINL